MVAFRQDDPVLDDDVRVSPDMLTYSRRRRGYCVTCGLLEAFCDCDLPGDDVTYQDDGEERRF